MIQTRDILLVAEHGKTEQKAQYVTLRAKGYSYARIAKRPKVGKGTLTAWSQELGGEIATL